MSGFIVRPADVLNNTKATKRSADKESIEKGLDAYISKQAVIPSSLMSLGEGQYDICRMGQTNCTANSVSLDELVSSGYLETIPFDPDCQSVTDTCYDLVYNSQAQEYEIVTAGDDTDFADISEGVTLTQGLVGWWKMDEASWNGTAGEVIDASGNILHGTRVGNATTVIGKYNNAGTFDGTGDYVAVADNSLLDITNAITVSVWAKATTTNPGNLDTIIAKGDNTYRIHTETVTKDAWMFDVSTTGGLCRADAVNGSVTTNWVHLVGVYDGQNCYLYIDGVEAKRSPMAGTILADNYALWIGNNSLYTWRDFPGLIDELRIYNRALAPTEIGALYGYVPGPVAHWKFDEGSGSVAYDSVGIYDASVAYKQRGGVLNEENDPLVSIFGSSVAISSDKKVLVVGALGRDSIRGGVYTYDLTGTSWSQRGEVLVASDAAVNSWYGNVDIRGDGEMLVVGAGGRNGSRGGVYTYDWDGSNWVQRGNILEAIDAELGDQFGSSVSLSEDGFILVVGARTWEGAVGSGRGGVYTYDWSGSDWIQRGGVLEAPDGADSDQFGKSTSLSADGNILIVGAPFWEGAVGSSRGGVYIFDRNGTSWVQRSTVLNISNGSDDDYFGFIVSATDIGNSLLVGASGWDPISGGDRRGGAYIFNNIDSNWVQKGEVIQAADAADVDQFGQAGNISSDGSVVIVGAPNWEGSIGSGVGGVYTYDLFDADWVNGRFNKAIKFDGVDDYLEVPNSNAINISGSMGITLSMWTKFDQLSSFGPVLVEKADVYSGFANGGYLLSLTSNPIWSDGTYRMCFIKTNGVGGSGGGNFGSNTNWDRVCSDLNDWDLDQWYHIAATWDGTLQSNSMKLYINGQLDATRTATQSTILGNSLPFIFGGIIDSGAKTDFHSGSIDDVRIYNYARTQEQIQKDMSNTD